MKKNIILAIVLLVFSLVLCGCDGVSVQQNSADLAYANIYREGVSLGYDGTLEEFLLLVKGVDGNGISCIKIDDYGYLVVTYTNTEQDFKIGRVKGEKGDKGDKGADGTSVVSMEINESGELLVIMSTDLDCPVNLGKVSDIDALAVNVTNGIDGINGVDGIDGINGIDGVDGINGVDGKDGVDGINGADGKDGKDGVDGFNGLNGIDGIDGNDGKSAYEIYKFYYPEYTKTEKEWLIDFIKGDLIARHNVTFHFYEGKSDMVTQVLDSDKVSKPSIEETARPQYNFVCWVGDMGAEYDFETAVSANIDLYALYEKNEPVLEDKGVIADAEIAVESLYKYQLIGCLTKINFEATSGVLQYEIFCDDTSLFEQTKTFTKSDITDFYDVGRLSFSPEGLHIIISYRGESGTLSMTIG